MWTEISGPRFEGYPLLMSDSIVYPYVSEYYRRRKAGEPRQRYLKLDVRNAWETLADVMGILGDGDDSGAYADLVARVLYSLCPGFNGLLPKGVATCKTCSLLSQGLSRCRRRGGTPCGAL